MYADDTISPESQTPLVQSTFGLKPHQKRDCSFCDAHVIHHVMTQVSLKQGLKKWPKESDAVVNKEMSQMHEKSVFEPTHGDNVTDQEKRGALNSIMFIKEKRCGLIKARACVDRRPQRKIYDKQDATSPTVKT